MQIYKLTTGLLALLFLFFSNPYLAANVLDKSEDGTTMVYQFVEEEVSVEPGGVANICVQRNYSLFSSTAQLSLQAPSGSFVSGGAQSLQFISGATETCFEVNFPIQTPVGEYKYRIDGVEEALLVKVENEKEIICGVFQNTPAENEAALAQMGNSQIYSDRFGNYYAADQLASFGGGLVCNSSGYFMLDFSAGFTAEEVATICQAFEDVSALFDAVEEDVTIPIRITQMDFGPGVHGAASAFFRTDGIGGGCGIEYNLVWEHINTPADFEEILQPGYVAGEFRVNSDLAEGDAWHTLNMDANGDFENPDVQDNFIDLYSVALHEAMHMLGFESRITPDGSPLEGFYSSWDRHLFGELPETLGTTPIIVAVSNDPSCCDAHQYNPAIGEAPSNLELGCDSTTDPFVVYQYGSTPANSVTVFGDYDEGAFEDPLVEMINVLSHINGCGSETYAMQSGLSDGIDRRVLSQTEEDILCSLGYELTGGQGGNCEAECNVVAIDDDFTAIPNGAGNNNNLIAISYADIIENDLFPVDLFEVGTYTIEVMDCDPFAELTIDNRPGPSDLQVIIHGLLAGYSHTVCYSIWSECGACDEGVITITVPQGDTPPVGPALCGETENIAPWGNFEAFDIGDQNGSLNGYFSYANLPAFDPLGINTGGGTMTVHNSPGVISLNGNQVGYLAGTVAGFNENNTNNESLYFPLSTPISPGCIATLSLDIMTNNNFGNGDVGNIQIYGATSLPWQVQPLTDCPANSTPDCLQLIWDGGPITAPIPDFETFDGITWPNNTPNAIYYLVVANHASAVYNGTSGQSAALLVDEIVVTQECSNELTITPNFIEACEGGQLVLDYELCLIGEVGTGATDIELTLELPNFPGLAFGDGDFQSGSLTVAGMLPGECETVTLILDLTNSPIGVGAELDFTLSATAPSTCFEGPVVTTVTIEDECLPTVFTCPCMGDNAINIDAGTGLSITQTVLWNDATSSPLAPFTYDNTNGCIAINGRLIIDEDLNMNPADFAIFEGEIRMQPGAEIVVNIDARFVLNEVNDNGGIHGCEEMWNGITMQAAAEIYMEECKLSDAIHGITLDDNTIVDLIDNTFIGNYIGLYTSLGTFKTILSNGSTPLVNNLFNGGALLPPFANSNAHSGIHLKNTMMLIGDENDAQNVNTFSKLDNGIVLEDKAEVSVDYVAIKNMPSFTLDPTDVSQTAGVGIYASQSPSIIRGSTIEADSPGNRGVFAFRSAMHIANNNITAPFGIDIRNGNNRVLEVVGNNITVNDLGVGLRLNNSDAAASILIEDNFFTSSTLKAVDFILMNNSGASSNGKLLIDNEFLIPTDNQRGIYMTSVEQWDIDNNIIFYSGNASTTIESTIGITAYLCSDMNITNNKVTGGYFHGIMLSITPNSIVGCNEIEGGHTSITIFGDCSNSLLRHNLLGDAEIGMNIWPGSIVGVENTITGNYEHVHTGNQWNGMYGTASARVMGTNSDVNNALFIVDCTAPFESHCPLNPDTPNSTTPWFIEQTGDAGFCKDTLMQKALNSQNDRPLSNSVFERGAHQAENTDSVIKIYPNPAQRFLQVELPSTLIEEPVQLTLFNMQGQFIQTWGGVINTTQQLDVEHIPSGIYSLSIKKNGQVISNHRIVILP